MAINTAAVERLYIAYFNRPSDPAGQAFWESKLSSTVAATQLELTVLAAGFSGSAEYASLYAGQTNAQIINSLYVNLFGRAAEPAGLLFWTNRLNAGSDTFASIALQLTYSAQGTDATAIANKVTAATAFTTAVNTSAEIIGYSGMTAAASARTWLAPVTDVTATLTAAVAGVDAAVIAAVAAGVSSNITLTATINTDNLTSGSGDDFLDGSAFVSQFGAVVNTLNTADQIDMGAGTDTAFFQLTGGVFPIKIKGIDILRLQATGAGAAIDFTQGDAQLTTASLESGAGFTSTLTNLQGKLATLNLTNQTLLQTVTTANAALSATTDALTINLSNVTGAGGVTVGPMSGTNGFETLNIVSGGGVTNAIGALTSAGETTINVSGTQALTFADANTTTTTVNAGAGATGTGSVMAGVLTYTASATNTNVQTITGGNGSDVFNMNGTFTSLDVINGGTGTNVLGSTSADLVAIVTADANVTNIQTLRATTVTAASTFRTDLIGTTVNQINFQLGLGGATVVRMNAGTDTVGVHVVGGGFGLTVEANGAATSDVLNLQLNGDDPVTAGTVLATLTVGALGFATATREIETVNIASSNALAGASHTVGTVTLNATVGITDQVNVSGTSSLTVGAVTADGINASGLTNNAALIMTAVGTAAGGQLIVGSAGADTLWGTAVGDQIQDGAGNDIIVGGVGADGISLQGGFNVLATGQSIAGGLALTPTNYDTITGFVVGATAAASDSFRIDVGAATVADAFFAATAIETAANAAVTVGEAVSVASVAQGLTVASVAANNFLKLTTGVAAAATAQLTFDAAVGAGALTVTAGSQIAGSFYDTTNSRAVIFQANATAATATEIDATDVITVIGMINMTAADYITFGANQLAFI